MLKKKILQFIMVADKSWLLMYEYNRMCAEYNSFVKCAQYMHILRGKLTLNQELSDFEDL